MEEGEQSEELLEQSQRENQVHKLRISISYIKTLFKYPTPFSFVDSNAFFLLVWVHFQSAVFIRYHLKLESLASWGFLHNLGFASIASHSVLSVTPCRNTLDKGLASTAFLSSGRLQNPFLISFTLKRTWMKVPSSAPYLHWNKAPYWITYASMFCFQ